MTAVEREQVADALRLTATPASLVEPARWQLDALQYLISILRAGQTPPRLRS